MLMIAMVLVDSRRRRRKRS